MPIEFVVELVLLVIVIIQFIVMIILFSKNRQGSQTDISHKLVEYTQRLEKNESTLRDEFGKNREETNKIAKDSRVELSSALKSSSDQLSTIISNFTGLVDNRITAILDSLERSSKSNRDELAASLKIFEEKSSAKIEVLTKDTKDGLEKTRDTVEKKLTEIQTGNEAKLDKMRETVEEKLEKTLNARISASFKQVSDDLEKVNKELVEMHVLASDVSDLKKVMANVKTKGVLGEYQLAAILEEILNQSQYEQNVKTKIGSNNHVEFAVKIPSKDDANKPVWLPIDSKLPTAAYEALNDAYNNIDKKALEDAKKIFSRTVKGFAKDIHDKYIDPPNTTDFAIMFLPIEGEYAEVVRDPELFESIRRESKVLVTGPSTIAALLNAFRVGFNSINVDKNTSKIRDLLSSVKKEFGNFENLIDKVKEKIDDAGKTLDDNFGKRTRAITRALKNVETVPDDTVGQKLLTDASADLED